MKNFFCLLLILHFSCSGHKSSANKEEIKLRVNSSTANCIGEMEGTCLLIQEGDNIGTANWELFYYEDSIKGFDYEPGYIYMLLVKKIPVKDPPADASEYQYELIEIISKSKKDD